jgi:hypothetical protein
MPQQHWRFSHSMFCRHSFWNIRRKLVTPNSCRLSAFSLVPRNILLPPPRIGFLPLPASGITARTPRSMADSASYVLNLSLNDSSTMIIFILFIFFANLSNNMRILVSGRLVQRRYSLILRNNDLPSKIMLLLVSYGIPSSWEKIENNSLRDTEYLSKEF